MLTFDKNSWHYSFADMFSNPNRKPSLCPYVRAVLWGMFLFTLLTTLLGMLSVTSILGAVLLFAGYGFTYNDVQGPVAIFLMTATILAGTCVYGLCQFLHVKYEQRQRRKYWAIVQARDDGTYVEPVVEPSLFKEYIKALHDKVCPSIEFKGESD